MNQQPAETVDRLLRRLRPVRQQRAPQVPIQGARFRKWPWIFLGLIVGSPVPITGAVMIGYRISVSRIASTLPDELAKARADGMHFELDDIRRAAYVDPARNGADLYRKAFPGIDEMERADYSSSRSSHSLERFPFSGDIRALLAKNDPDGKLVAQIEAAAKSPDVDWKRSWLYESYDGPYGVPTERSRLVQMAGLLSGLAMSEARDGNFSAAENHIANALRISLHVGREPMQASIEDMHSIQGHIFRALEFMLNQKPAKDDLLRIRSMIAGLPPSPDPRTCSCYGLAQTMREIEMDEAEVKKRRGTKEAWQIDFPQNLIYQYPEFGLARRAKAIHYARLEFEGLRPQISYHELCQFSNAMAELLDKDHSAAAHQDYGPGLPSGLFHDRTFRRLLLSSIDLLLIRLGSGKLPAALPRGDEFVDPYTDKPFVYKRIGAGFEVYSLSENGTDDSAKPKWHKSGDIVLGVRD